MELFGSTLGNVLGIAVIGVVGYVFYTKLWPKIKEKIEDLKKNSWQSQFVYYNIVRNNFW